MKKLSLAVVAAVAVAAGLLIAQTAPKGPAFEVASIKQDTRVSWVRRPWTPNINCAPIGHCGVSGNRFTEEYASLDDLIMDAYSVRRHQIINLPNWGDTGQDVYDIDARAAGGGALTLDQARRLLQTLLADRFHLRLHHETRELPVYVLAVGKNGSKLVPSEKACNLPGFVIQPRDQSADKGGGKGPGKEDAKAQDKPDAKVDDAMLIFQSWGIVPEMLAGRLDRPVIDKTGFGASTYCTATGDAALDTLLLNLGRGGGARGGDPQNRTAIPDSDAAGPSIFTAVEDLWGLKLEAQKAPVDVVVIDSVERPSEN